MFGNIFSIEFLAAAISSKSKGCLRINVAKTTKFQTGFYFDSKRIYTAALSFYQTHERSVRCGWQKPTTAKRQLESGPALYSSMKSAIAPESPKIQKFSDRANDTVFDGNSFRR